MVSRMWGGRIAPRVGLRPRDVHEEVQERLRAGGADHAGGDVEVVVVEHHHRASGASRSSARTASANAWFAAT